MQLPLFSDYSLRILLYLTMHRQRLVSVPELSSAYGARCSAPKAAFFSELERHTLADFAARRPGLVQLWQLRLKGSGEVDASPVAAIT